MYYKTVNGEEEDDGDGDVGTATTVPDPLSPPAIDEADRVTELMTCGIITVDKSVPNPRRNTAKRKATRSIVIESESFVRPAWNQSP